MSQPKKDKLFPIKLRAISDDELAKIVASALRQDFGEMTSAVKQIGGGIYGTLSDCWQTIPYRWWRNQRHLFLVTNPSLKMSH